MLSISNLIVSVDNKEILKGLNLEVEPGEVHAIMGPNGSGKSTLAYVLAGHPKYKISDDRSKISVDGQEIGSKTPDQRANLGLFLAMQYPVAVPGLSTQSFLWQIYKKRNEKLETGNKNKTNIIEFRKWLESQAKALGFDSELLKRNLNDGFSGGEKKKLEILQMLVSMPKYLILDEIDSGLDVDALRKIAKTVALVAKERGIGVVLITHYSRILEYIKPDRVHRMDDGIIVESGGDELVKRIEDEGYVTEEESEVSNGIASLRSQ